MPKFDPTKTLKAVWSKREEDILIYSPCRPDGHLLWGTIGGKVCSPDTKTPGWKGHIWEPSLIEELEKRGYDITTLKFSIKKKL
jgi:hypothetical protein